MNDYTFDTQLPPCTNLPCNECPWRRAAEPGHLGPYTAQEWVEIAHSESPIMCHKTLRHGDHDWSDPEIRQCRGAAIFRANIFKNPRNPTAATGQRDIETVFAWNDQFIEHHAQVHGEK